MQPNINDIKKNGKQKINLSEAQQSSIVDLTMRRANQLLNLSIKTVLELINCYNNLNSTTKKQIFSDKCGFSMDAVLGFKAYSKISFCQKHFQDVIIPHFSQEERSQTEYDTLKLNIIVRLNDIKQRYTPEKFKKNKLRIVKQLIEDLQIRWQKYNYQQAYNLVYRFTTQAEKDQNQKQIDKPDIL